MESQKESPPHQDFSEGSRGAQVQGEGKPVGDLDSFVSASSDVKPDGSMQPSFSNQGIPQADPVVTEAPVTEPQNGLDATVNDLEKAIISQIVPQDLSVKYSAIRTWLVQPFLFTFSLSFKTQMYILGFILIIIFVVLPLILYCCKKVGTAFNPIHFDIDHVLVIGGSNGLGKEIVREVFKKGALVSIIGRDEKQLQEINRELDSHNEGEPLIRYICADITKLSSAEIKAVLHQLEKYLGPIRMVVFCPAKSEPAMITSSDVDKFKTHMDTNFFSALKFILPISQKMATNKQKGGRIVIVGDPMATQSTVPGMAAYACSKHALEALAMQLRAELMPHNIKVHYFLPVMMQTNFLFRQKQIYPLVTKEMLKHRRTSEAEYMAKKLLRGITMEEFIICGSFSITFMTTLKAQFRIAFNLFFAPIAIMLRMYEDMRVSDQMFAYRYQHQQNQEVSSGREKSRGRK